MNAVELFRKGRKVRTRAGEYTIGTNLKLKGEDFWRRVNSDGTLSRIGDGTNGTVHFNTSLVPSERNKLAKEHQKSLKPSTSTKIAARILPQVLGNFKTSLSESIGQYLLPHEWNMILRNSQGQNEGSLAGNLVNVVANTPLNAVASVLSFFTQDDREYYAGRTDNKTNRYYNNLTGPKVKEHNLINLFTHQDDKGFEPSEPGVYTNNPKYKDLPAYKSNFYGDTIYLPDNLKPTILAANNKFGWFNKDIIDMSAGVYDARNHRATIMNKEGNPYMFFEDVFDTGNSIVDKYNYPAIINQKAPIVFTNNRTLLNRSANVAKRIQELAESTENGEQYK